MSRYFLGVDIGATKSHALIADEDGHVLGFGEGGPGNQEAIGYDGFGRVLNGIVDQALLTSGLTAGQISGTGMGIAGCDWPCDIPPIDEIIRALALGGPYEFSNDATVGLLAGASDGWGVGVVAGTGCNCRGRDREGREGRVTGEGGIMGESGGSGDLARAAIGAIARAWTRRGPETKLAQVFVELFGATGVENMLEGITRGRYRVAPAHAPLVFRTADEGDLVAQQLIRDAARDLASQAIGVIRQLHFEPLEFEVVMAGSFFKGHPIVGDLLAQTVQVVAPGASFVRLTAPPVIGGVVMGMQQVGLRSPDARLRLIEECAARATA
jgi:N-acetylglucosamine kinase-like BadF-type ATPase